MGVHTSKSKICSMSEAVSKINDGDMIAVGGNLSAREPMGLIREIIRQNKHNLHCIGGAHGIDIDLLCAGGAVKTIQHSYVGFEADFGLAPNYRRAVEQGLVEPKDTDCVAVMTHLRATVFGVPFMPLTPIRGTDVLKFNPEAKIMDCPYTGQSVSLLPAIKPDCAVIHAHKADAKGNVKLFEPYFADLLASEASGQAIVSVEEIVSEEEMCQIGPNIPYYQVSAVVELPYGAHPTSCYPNYAYDRKHFAEYVRLAKQGRDVFDKQYLEKYVLEPKSHQGYLDLVGGMEYLKDLTKWSQSTQSWRGLLQESA
jgi:glutaconate CoA-transferase subunit A